LLEYFLEDFFEQRLLEHFLEHFLEKDLETFGTMKPLCLKPLIPSDIIDLLMHCEQFIYLIHSLAVERILNT